MFVLDFTKLAVCLKVKRGKRGLREAAEEIDTLSPSTLNRIEGQRVDDIAVSTFLAIVNWLEMEPDEFLHDSNDRKYFKPDYSVADEIKILLGSSDLPPFYAKMLAAMMDAALDVITRGDDD